MTALVLALFVLLCAAAARPTLHRRGLPGAVYTCTLTNFRGECQWSSPTNRCRQPGPASLGLGIQSLGPDPGGFCTLYDKFDCTGSEIQTIRFPGLSVGIPQFGAFRCFADQGQAETQLNFTVNSTGPAKVLDPFADPRLAGGIGSMERKKHLEEIERMEENGFRDGLIGLKKGIYY